ncbi:helix-turn-helix domain-containing protein [Corynebacterium durum]|nr:helix-turn-helix domain-containing protein [Corynebacterium durum]
MKLWFSRNKSNGDNATAAESEEVRPLVAVTRAIEGGATTVSAIVQQTGLQESTVSAAMEHLERTGYIHRRLDVVCGGSCGGCALSDDEGGTCNHTATPGTPQGLVTLTLTRRVPGAPGEDPEETAG